MSTTFTSRAASACLLAAVFAFGSAPASATPTAPPKPAPTAALAPGPAFPPLRSDTLDRIARLGAMRVGFIPTPGTFAFRDAEGQVVGYSIDLCHRVIDAVRRQLRRPELRVEFRAVGPAERIPLLKAGAIDIECGGNTNTVARQREVDFSYTFFNTGVRFLVRRPLTLEGPSSLFRRRVAVTRGTTAEEMVMRLAVEQDVVPLPVATDADGVRAVEAGIAEAYAQDDVLLYGLAAASPHPEQLAVTGRFLTVEPYAFMLPRGDRAFRELVDTTLRELMQTGTIHAIYRKWFDTEHLRIPLNVYMQENFRFPNRYGIP